MPSAEKTQFLELNQWDGNEYPKRLDYVEDNQKIDVKAKEHDDRIATVEEKLNSPDFNSLSLTMTTQVQSATDSVVSPSEVIIEGTSLQQVCDEGDFENGTNGWYGNNGAISVTNKVMKQIANGNSNTPYISKNPAINLPISEGMEIPIKVRARALSSDCTQLRVSYRGTTGGATALATFVSSPVVNTWYDLETIITVPAGYTGYLDLFVFHFYNTAAIANGKAMEVEGDWERGGGVFVIPITGTPQAGFTLEQMKPLTKKWWYGLKSVESIEIGSRGRNLINKYDLLKGFAWSASVVGAPVVVGVNIEFDSSRPIRVIGGTTIKYSGDTFDMLYVVDKSLNLIAQYTTGITELSLAQNAYFALIRCRLSDENFDNAMLNVGATTLPYEEYKGSFAKITCTDPASRFAISQLPNLTTNRWKFKDGKQSVDVNVGPYTLKSSDITAVSVDNGLVVRYGVVNNQIPQTAKINVTNGVNNVMVEGWPTQGLYDDRATTNMVGKFYTSTSETVVFGFVTGTSLATAQAALNGVNILYELATPIETFEESFTSVIVEGELTSNDGYTEYFVNDYDMYPSVLTIDYSTNISAAVQSLKEGQQGIHDILDELLNPTVYPLSVIQTTGWNTDQGWSGVIHMYKNREGQVSGTISAIKDADITLSEPVNSFPSGFIPTTDTMIRTIGLTDTGATLAGTDITIMIRAFTGIIEITALPGSTTLNSRWVYYVPFEFNT